MSRAKDDVQAVKDRVSLTELVKRFADVRPMGNRMMAPCPFHQETKPSFSINEAEGYFYCFGCQEKGDVIDFFARIHGLEFREALERLAAEVGVTLTGKRDENPEKQRQRKARARQQDICELAAQYFRQRLAGPEGAPCRGYLQRRGVTGAIARDFALGWAPAGWQGLCDFLTARGASLEDAVACGLVGRSRKGDRLYDRFRGRLIFPILDAAGKVVAFGGRILMSDEDAPKYINSSDSAVYKKGEHLYGLHAARRLMSQSRAAVLTEGYMDVITLHQYGFANACGVLGTALTPEQVRRLSHYCSTVELVFDGDRAGRKAAFRSAELLLTGGMACKVSLLPEGLDIDDLLRTRGAEAFQTLRRNAPDGLDHCLTVARETMSPKEIIEWSKRFLGNMESPELARYFAPKVRRGLGLEESSQEKAANTQNYGASSSFRRKRYGKPLSGKELLRERIPYRKTAESDASLSGKPGGASPEKMLLRFAFCFPQHLPLLCERGAERLVTSPRGRLLWETLVDHGPEAATTQLANAEAEFFQSCAQQADAMRDNDQEHLDDILRQLDALDVKTLDANYIRQAGDEIEALKEFTKKRLWRGNG